MKIIKLGLISLVVLFGLITLISSLLPAQVRISRAIDIYAPAEKVYSQVSDVRQWENWNEYVKNYHNRKTEVNGLSADEITIAVTRKTDSLIQAEWNRPGGYKFGNGFAIIAQDSAHTIVQYYFDFHLAWYPWEKFQSIVYDQQFGPVMERSLANLKKIAENIK